MDEKEMKAKEKELMEREEKLIAQNIVLRSEDIEAVKSFVKPSSRTIGLMKDFNEMVKKSARVVPIVTALATLDILRELRKITELLKVKEEEKPRKLKK